MTMNEPHDRSIGSAEGKDFSRPVPSELRLRAGGRELRVAYEDGESYTMSAQYLRVYTPSAEVRGHGGPGNEKWPVGKEAVLITGIEPVGNYAIRLVFDDGHDTGLYSWRLLHELGRDQEANWARYLANTEQQQQDG